MNAAAVCAVLRRARDDIRKAQLRTLEAGGVPVSGGVLAAIDKALDAGTQGDPAFPTLVARALSECGRAVERSLRAPDPPAPTAAAKKRGRT